MTTPPPLPQHRPPPLPGSMSNKQLFMFITAAVSIGIAGIIAWSILGSIAFKFTPEGRARATAFNKLEQHFRKCGSSWVTFNPNNRGNFDPWDYTELKDLQVRSRTLAVSDPDRLNGIQWMGRVTFTATALRRHYNYSGGFPPVKEGWGAWGNSKAVAGLGGPSFFDEGPVPAVEMTIIQQNGVWKFAGGGGVEDWQKAPECSSIPK